MTTVRRGATPILLVATFVLSASGGVIFPLLADLQDAYGIETAGLGLMTAAQFVAALATQLALSSQADRGRSRQLLVGGVACAVVALVVLGTATSLVWFVVGRALGGVALGAFLPAARAAAAADDEHRGRDLGRLASAELAGFVTSPVVGASLAAWLGLHAPFFVLAAVTAAVLPILVRHLPDTPARADATARPLDSVRLLSDRGVVVVAIMSVANLIPVGVYDALWARYLTDRGAGTLFVGLSLSLYGVPFIAFASRGGAIAQRHGPLRSAFLAHLAIVPLVALYGVLSIPVLIASIAIIDAVFQAVAVPGIQAAMADAAPDDQLAAGQGLAGACGLVGASITALVAAPAYERFGGTWVFIATATVVGALVLVAFAVNGGSQRQRPRAR